MKFSKKLFKKLLCTSLSAVMLTGTMSFGTAFASTGIIADSTINDVVKFNSADAAGLFVNPNGNSFKRENGEVLMTTPITVKDDVVSYPAADMQARTIGLPVDKSGDIMGSIIFDIKADEKNDSAKDSFVIYAAGADDGKYNGTPSQIPFIHMYADSKIGTPSPTTWSDKQGENMTAAQGQRGTYYRVGITFKNDNTYDIYVDGSKIGNVPIDDTYKAMFDNMSNIYFWWNVRDNDFSNANKDTGNIAKFYFKNFIWQKGGGELVAEADKTSYSAGDTATIKFSAPLAGTIDTDAVKLYESATGVPVDGTSVTYENGEFKVTIPASIKSGAEYRIELPTVTDCIGNTLKNDNVYFNAAQGGDAYEVIDTYETFDSLGAGDYVAPTGWHRQNRWAVQSGVFAKSAADETNGTSLEIGKITATAGSKDPDFNQGGLYYPLSKKYTDGTVAISYDIKPKQYTDLDYYNSPSNTQASFDFVGYANKLTDDQIKYTGDNGDPGTINGIKGASPAKVLSSVIGTSLGYPVQAYTAAPQNHTYNTAQLDAYVGKVKTFTEGELNERWYNVKVELNFDKGTYTYYLDNEMKYTSATLLTELGLNEGIAAIGMAISGYSHTTDQLIDNIKVSHITSKTLDNATTVFADDFSGYYKKEWTPEEPTTNNYTVNFGEAWVPQGWGHRDLGWTQAAPVLLPTTVDTEHGNSLEMGIKLDATNSNAQWNNPELYHRLGQKYTNGVLTVAYEVNPKTLIDIDDSRLDAAKTAGWYTSGTASNSFGFTLYADNYSESEGISAPGSNRIYSQYGMRIFGVQDKNFSVYTNNQLTKGLYGYSAKSSAAEGQWYKVKHIIDIDNDSIETYLGTSDANMNLFGVNHLSYFSNKDGVSLADGIGGIGFCVNERSYLSYTYLDNVSVSYAPFKSQKGVSAVRYSDYKDNIYGSSDSTTTLIDTVALAFTDAPDDIDGKVTITDSKGNSIGYSGILDSETNTYVMNLSEFLTAAETYTLTVDGVTFGGEAMDTYTHTIYAETNGEFIIEPMTISVNDVVKSTGTNIGKQQLASGDTVKATVRVINTTGQKKDVAFSAGIYKDKLLDKFDYRTVSLDGTSTDGKYAEESCTFTMGADASEVTKVRTFLWNGMKDMLPLMESCDLDCSAE